MQATITTLAHIEQMSLGLFKMVSNEYQRGDILSKFDAGDEIWTHDLSRLDFSSSQSDDLSLA